MGAAIFAANIGSEHLVGLAGAGANTGMGMSASNTIPVINEKNFCFFISVYFF